MDSRDAARRSAQRAAAIGIVSVIGALIFPVQINGSYTDELTKFLLWVVSFVSLVLWAVAFVTSRVHMPRSRHIFAGIAWVAACLVIGIAILNRFAAGIRDLSWNHELPPNLMKMIRFTYDVVAIAVLLVIPAIVTVLAIRARLPWTGERGSSRRGFPVEPPRDAA